MILDTFSSGIPLRSMAVAAVWRIRRHSHPRPMLRSSKISNGDSYRLKDRDLARTAAAAATD
jgi:hypothetical protein